MSLEQKREVVQTLSRYGHVFITSESKLTDEFEPYRLNLPPRRVHDLMFYTQLFLGDGATIPTKAHSGNACCALIFYGPEYGEFCKANASIPTSLFLLRA